VSDAPVRPRIEVLDPLAPRLEPPVLEVVSPPRLPVGNVALGLAGLAVVGLGLAGLSIGNFVADQFVRSAVLGWTTLAVAGLGGSLLGAGIWREIAGLLRLRAVDGLRARLSDPRTMRDAALAWLETQPEGAAVAPAVRAANDPDAILSLLRAGPVAALRARSEVLGRAAAINVFAVTAAIPSPSLDGLLVAWRGVRLVREVAALHGMRPGVAGTFSLLRRVFFSGATVAAANLAADTAMRAVLGSPLLAHVTGDVAGAGVAARRMVVLARATAASCCPVPD
jgi:uncharacterized membrane protein YcjF (UPF0283 family)